MKMQGESTGKTGVAIIGCGYVFDHYMTTAWAHPEIDVRGVYDIDLARSAKVSDYYGFSVYPDLQAILDDPTVTLVLNLTSIEAHFELTRALLEGGKHVYSEKPLTTDLEEARTLFRIAEERGLVLSSAPCNFLSDSVQTMWKAVRDGAIGKPLLIYAEFDDNPIYLMKPETWRSRTGAPWPYIHEYEMGCTFEHVGYHLVWMLAMFGPVRSVTAFSKVVVPHKTDQPMHPADTPDFSVATLDFVSGVTARVTCSIAAPADHRMRVIGDEGELSTDTYRHYQSPVFLERFSQLSLNARKARSLRLQPLFGGRTGAALRAPLEVVRDDARQCRGQDLILQEAGRRRQAPRGGRAGQDARRRRDRARAADGRAVPDPARFHPPRHRADAGDPGRGDDGRRGRANHQLHAVRADGLDQGRSAQLSRQLFARLPRQADGWLHRAVAPALRSRRCSGLPPLHLLTAGRRVRTC
ncbi:gfo/Idh/MocA family oxidoreductase [Sphingomonas sp. ABOLE]|uniref:Gfo/Idh/MocA family protein n=1 Tax=Sphingomonas sp. ABOLE TaxID=1985878 RepID=UPI000F7F79C2|nr:Gfo/Idh/MocA family oxidoreductase [Sphingomonas sp. ABOLE]RSV44965.1 gfo/Idh/MocA family oxidoreductase [Sphingomonas sp. ABOLE]